MKPDVVITAYTPGGYYHDCIPLVHDAWERIGIKFVAYPALRLGMPHPSNDAKITRLLQAALSHTDEVVMLTDADMVPISARVFDLPIFTGGVICIGGDAYDNGKLPVCYMIAPGKTWAGIVGYGVPLGWTGYRFKDDKEDPYCTSFSDESLLRILFEQADIQPTIIPRGWDKTPDGLRCHNRIDRADWKIDMDKLQAGEYIDAHLPRGSDWKEKVKPLADYLGLTI